MVGEGEGGKWAQFLSAGTWYSCKTLKVGLYLQDKNKNNIYFFAFGNIEKRGGKTVSVGKQTPFKRLEPPAPSHGSVNCSRKPGQTSPLKAVSELAPNLHLCL